MPSEEHSNPHMPLEFREGEYFENAEREKHSIGYLPVALSKASNKYSSNKTNPKRKRLLRLFNKAWDLYGNKYPEPTTSYSCFCECSIELQKNDDVFLLLRNLVEHFNLRKNDEVRACRNFFQLLTHLALSNHPKIVSKIFLYGIFDIVFKNFWPFKGRMLSDMHTICCDLMRQPLFQRRLYELENFATFEYAFDIELSTFMSQEKQGRLWNSVECFVCGKIPETAPDFNEYVTFSGVDKHGGLKILDSDGFEDYLQARNEVKATHRKCEQCKLVFYCDEACQKSAWKKHKKICGHYRYK